jgi:hypothetical protein
MVKESPPEERLDNGRPLVTVHDVDIAPSHQIADDADHFPGWASPMPRELDVLDPHFPHPLHQRTCFRQQDHLVSTVADRPGQLHGIEL